jgi:hypothetical protein
MQPNLSYVKDRLLSAGRHLQKGIATLEDGETYRTMHDAQNQLALALATVVTMEREGTAVTIPTPVTDAINEHDRVYALIRALRDEADEPEAAQGHGQPVHRIRAWHPAARRGPARVDAPVAVRRRVRDRRQLRLTPIPPCHAWARDRAWQGASIRRSHTRSRTCTSTTSD